MKTGTGSTCIPLEIGDVDRLIHDPTRLMLISYLFVVDSADFVFLQNHTKLTPGNISSHMTKLEAAGYVKITKRFVGKRPQTMFKLTSKGRAKFERYRNELNGALFLQAGTANADRKE
jgi:DNA-binding MarR family transcriptional regulator